MAAVARRCIVRCCSAVASAPGMGTAVGLNLNFDNLALRSLPVDSSGERSCRRVPGACFSLAGATPVDNPRLVASSRTALELLELPPLPEALLADHFSGNAPPAGSRSAAHCYCGHQFGSFAGQLGDGAALYLGEVVNSRGQRWELQLKGAGPTPYSRQSDGRKVLRSSIREFLCSEAMFHLGIPTTRAGTCVTSDTKVLRDVFYDGNSKHENCTIILRIAPTFLRFGSFEILKPEDELTGRQGPSSNRNDIRIQMLDYVIGTFYPETQQAHPENQVQRNAAFFREVTQRTARLVAEWQCVGFCHGVLNTDNMSIMGLTIDYGPFGFMDRFDPSYICNASDNRGRYAYNQQPEICKWNLGKLAEVLVPELPLKDSQSIIDEEYDTEFQRHYLQKMRKKLGLLQCEQEDDDKLVSELLDIMYRTGADFTNVFRVLSGFPIPGVSASFTLSDFLEKLIEQSSSLEELKLAFTPRMDPRQLSILLMLSQSNPQLFEVIGSKEGIAKELDLIERSSKLQQATAEDIHSNNAKVWTEWLQKYSSRLATEAEGVDDVDEQNAERVKVMNLNNPKFILRNYIAQNAIEAAEKGDFSEVRRVLTLLESPYSEDSCLEEETLQDAAATVQVSASCDLLTRTRVPYNSKPPPSAGKLLVT
eukprot:gi/632947628/ref/XP_007889143.1/ PREDICTED: selenoprotein O [Callorhinchus milii]